MDAVSFLLLLLRLTNLVLGRRYHSQEKRRSFWHHFLQDRSERSRQGLQRHLKNQGLASAGCFQTDPPGSGCVDLAAAACQIPLQAIWWFSLFGCRRCSVIVRCSNDSRQCSFSTSDTQDLLAIQICQGPCAALYCTQDKVLVGTGAPKDTAQESEVLQLALQASAPSIVDH